MNSLYINGAHVPLGQNTFNAYDMLHVVRAEVDHISQLQSFQTGPYPLSADNIHALKDTATDLASDDGNAEKQTYRVDVSRGAKYVVTFLNNLEKDMQYKSWPKKLAILLQPSWQISQIQRNLYTIVATPDVLSYDGALLAYQFNMVVAQQYPIRVGIVPMCTPADNNVAGNTEDDHRTSSSVATRSDVCNLFVVLRDKYSNKVATNFISSISENTLEREQRKQQAQDLLDSTNAAAAGTPSASSSSTHVEEISKLQLMIDELSATELKEVLNIYAAVVAEHVAEYDDSAVRATMSLHLQDAFPSGGGKTVPKTREGYRKEARTILNTPQIAEYTAEFRGNISTYMYDRGLQPNTYSMNGIVEKSLDLQQTLSQLLSREQNMMRQWFSTGKITDKSKSMFTTILSLNRAYPRYHPLLEQTGGHVEYYNTGKKSNIDSDTNSDDLLGNIANISGGYHVTPETVDRNKDVVFSGTTVLSVPINKSGFEALHAALKWISSPVETASTTTQPTFEDSNEPELPSQRLSYFFTITDSLLSCFSGDHADTTEHDNGSCDSNVMLLVPYLRIASLIQSLQVENNIHENGGVAPVSLTTDIKLLLSRSLQSLQSDTEDSDVVSTLISEVIPSLVSFNSLSNVAQEHVIQSVELPSENEDLSQNSLVGNLNRYNEITR